ncbi:MAG: DMT family transporter [Pannonibacter phragmitetus]|uniref:Predicted permease, DMT superfamily n=1 Tax=Pannonibacter phragmitetus TaxID=121719 RepID=A0A379A0A6_9HYPH|nr:DMT family transporter [Pannonibacter phragmitetus]SUB02643.1 Predicted permease, DMT superfamily [Pannonibacter phragmitetus]
MTSTPDGSGSEQREESRSQLIGIGMLLLACFLFAGLDATAKYLVRDLPAFQVVWVRFVTHMVLAFFLFRIWAHPEYFRTDRPVLMILRGFCLLGNTSFNFLAMRHLQLAETMSIMFAGTILVTALAVPMLGEKVGPRRWAAVFVGFIGVLVIVQPGSGPLNWAVIYSLLSMVCYALYTLLTRMLSTTDSTLSMLIIPAAVASLAMAPGGISVWQAPPSLFHWGLLLSTGVLGGLGHWILISAYRRAPASVLAPFTYVQIIWMISLGYLVFADLPGSSTLIGASIVVSSGLYILYREQIVKKR